MKTTVRFFRHGGIYGSDVFPFFKSGPTLPLSGRVRPRLSERTGKFCALPIVAMSSGRLFLNGMLASRARLRFTGTPILNPFRGRAQ
jgi:hypothetical protein